MIRLSDLSPIFSCVFHILLRIENVSFSPVSFLFVFCLPVWAIQFDCQKFMIKTSYNSLMIHQKYCCFHKYPTIYKKNKRLVIKYTTQVDSQLLTSNKLNTKRGQVVRLVMTPKFVQSKKLETHDISRQNYCNSDCSLS